MISVPPRSAYIALIFSTASSMAAFSFLGLSLKRYLYELPKLSTLKQLSSGRLLRKISRARLALSILRPSIDPLLSSRKMYSPLLASRLTSIDFPARCCLQASSMERAEYLGMKDMAAVVLLSECEREYSGLWQFQSAQERVKSLLGSSLASAKVAVTVLFPFYVIFILCVSDFTFIILCEDRRVTFTLHTHFPSIFTLPGKELNINCCTCMPRAQRGVMAEVSLYWQMALQSRELLWRQVRTILTVCLGAMLPTFIFIMSLLSELYSPSAAPPPSRTCRSNSALASAFSITTPSLRCPPNSTSSRLTVAEGCTGKMYCTSSGRSEGLTQSCVRTTCAKQSTISMSQEKLLSGSSIGGFLGSGAAQHPAMPALSSPYLLQFIISIQYKLVTTFLQPEWEGPAVNQASDFVDWRPLEQLQVKNTCWEQEMDFLRQVQLRISPKMVIFGYT